MGQTVKASLRKNDAEQSEQENIDCEASKCLCDQYNDPTGGGGELLRLRFCIQNSQTNGGRAGQGALCRCGGEHH